MLRYAQTQGMKAFKAFVWNFRYLYSAWKASENDKTEIQKWQMKSWYCYTNRSPDSEIQARVTCLNMQHIQTFKYA